MLFGERLYAERKKSKLSAEKLAEECEISRSYITLIENGRRTPGKKVLAKIADALHIKVSVVLNWYLENIAQKIQKDLKIS